MQNSYFRKKKLHKGQGYYKHSSTLIFNQTLPNLHLILISFTGATILGKPFDPSCRTPEI